MRELLVYVLRVRYLRAKHQQGNCSCSFNEYGNERVARVRFTSKVPSCETPMFVKLTQPELKATVLVPIILADPFLSIAVTSHGW